MKDSGAAGRAENPVRMDRSPVIECRVNQQAYSS
jgi:hypothetical protein